MQKLREQLHADSKNAIKTLRFLRERRCLEVAASPTESTNSYENFYYLAHAFPQQRFLVLSLERQLAEELKKAPGSNAVVMKIGLDGGLLPLRATRQVFQGMLSGHPASAAERRRNLKSVHLSCRRLPHLRSRFKRGRRCVRETG